MASHEPIAQTGSPEAASPMTPERWRVVDEVLQGALAYEGEERERFVQEACDEDAELRREVESLLSAHDDMAADFLEQPAVAAFGEATAPLPDETRIAALAEALAGRYAIEREIARGGMATVYLARDVRHGRRVAIKVMRDEVAAAVGAERFLEEIRVTALLQHPNILPLFDSGKLGALLWYVMPFVEGETLRSRLSREGRLVVGEAMRIARQIADALEHAHAHGIVHRDIKPENVLLQDGHALVADFGIALALEHAGSERLTQTGLTLGTPQYMAPEQASGERAIDARVDVYALGAVTYEMLAGESPFAAVTRQAVVQRMLSETPVTLAKYRADVPASLDGAVRRALARQPDDRFPTPKAFAAALITPSDTSVAQARSPSDLDANSRNALTIAPARRAIAAHVVVYSVLGALALGLALGLGIGRWSFPAWRGNASPARQWSAQTAGAVASDANGAGDADGLALVVVDRGGRVEKNIAANRPWTPRFSPDGRRVAYGAFGAGRTTSDLWVADVSAGTVVRLTDDDADSNDPQWSPDGKAIAYSVNAPGGKDVAMRKLTGDTTTRIVAARPGTQFPSDWMRDGSALIVTDNEPVHEILVQPVDGADARPIKTAGETATSARMAPNGRWIAYTSPRSGRSEVWLDSYPSHGWPVLISRQGGADPVWRADGKELYYWRGDTLVAVTVDASRGDAPTLGGEVALFRAPYQTGINTMYDVSPDGQRFVIVERR